MIFEVRSAKNGFIIKVNGEEELVFEEKEEIENFAQFLRLLDESYGPMTNRYSDKRIYVRVYPGDKYEGPNPEADEAFQFFLEHEENPTIESAFLAGWSAARH